MHIFTLILTTELFVQFIFNYRGILWLLTDLSISDFLFQVV